MGWRFGSPGGDGFCPECGEDAAIEAKPNVIERVRHFLAHGMPVPAVWVCPNGHETDGRAGSALSIRAPRLPRMVRTPLALARAIHDGRSVEPVPLTYLMAAGAGLALGIVLDVWLDVPWWLVAAAFVVAVWLLFLSSAWWSGARHQTLRTLRHTLNARREQRRELQAFAEQVSRGKLAAYVVADWPGLCRIAGWGVTDTKISSLTLTHLDDEAGEDRWIMVASHMNSDAPLGLIKEVTEQDFIVKSVELPSGPEGEDAGRRMARRRWEAMQRPRPVWTETIFEIDGTAMRAEMLEAASSHVVLVALGDGHVVIEARGYDPGSFAISRVRDLEPYVAGLNAID